MECLTRREVQLVGVNLHVHIVTKPAVLLRPMQRPLQFTAPIPCSYVRAEARAAQVAARCRVLRLPPIRAPHHLKQVLVQNPQRTARANSLDRPPPGVNFQTQPPPASALRLAVPLIYGINAVEDLSILGRTQKLQILGVS